METVASIGNHYLKQLAKRYNFKGETPKLVIDDFCSDPEIESTKSWYDLEINSIFIVLSVCSSFSEFLDHLFTNYINMIKEKLTIDASIYYLTVSDDYIESSL